METNNRPGKIICLALLVVLLILALTGIFVWVAFTKSDAPTVKVQRLSIPRFDVEGDVSDDQVVLSADFNFFVESDNSNSMTSASLESMVMGVSWNEYGVGQLGQTSVKSVKQASGRSDVMEIRAHGVSDVRKKEVKREDLKLDVALSGTIVFSCGPIRSSSYAFLVTCHGVTAASKDVPCTTKLYSSENVNYRIGSTSPPPVAPSPGSASVLAGPPVKLVMSGTTVILDNGILALTISNPEGYIVGIRYNGIENILDAINPEDDRGYWDVVWTPSATNEKTKGNFDRLKCTIFRVIVDTEDQLEVSFSRSYDPAFKEIPLNVDLRYILLRGKSGIYSYAIFERQKWPPCTIANARLAFKLFRTKFRYLSINDKRQRKMPLPEDRGKDRGKRLAYPEAVMLTNPIDSEFKGEVDDKYQYSDESKDIKVHGYYSSDPAMGFWQISPSYESRIGGPNKQFLTSHVGPSVLAMFISSHYTGEHVIPHFEEGEPWKKVLGPVFLYLNRMDQSKNASFLWEDAKTTMQQEANAWPYNFPASDDFLKANQRANVTGRLFIHDRFVNESNMAANGAYVGLANPGEAGSWQTECKGYQFWTTTDGEGRFKISHVIPGAYNLFGWAPGFIGDFKHNVTVNMTVGHNIDLGDIVYEPPRDGPTLWEIGEPERTAKEFFVPDPDPSHVNKLYVDHPEKFRQYGLWERYAEIYPTQDLVYTVNKSTYQKDWFFAHVTRKVNNEYSGTTWRIVFNLGSVGQGVYKMRLAVAGSSNAMLEVRVNEPVPSDPVFIAGTMGRDNSIARHGIHGVYWLFNIDIQDSKLKVGENTIFLTQTKNHSPFQGVMYDYIRLEAPSSNNVASQ